MGITWPLGVNIDRFARCEIDYPFACYDYLIQDNEVKLLISNRANTEVQNVIIEVECGLEKISSEEADVIGPGNKSVFTIVCPSTTKTISLFYITYKDSTGTNIVQGEFINN